MRALLIMLAFLAHLATSHGAPVKTAPPVVKKAAVPDAEIESRIRQRFAKSTAAKDGFQVKVQNGVATITGKTEVVQRKGAATRMAKTAGAREVRNLIQVSERAKAKLAARFEQARNRGSAVKRSEVSRP